jgi:hypothetical protein
MSRLLLALTFASALGIAGCAATIREEAGRAAAGLPPETAASLLDGAWSRLERGKRIFDIRLADRARVLHGQGAIVYRNDPLRLRLDVFGPHSTEVLALAQEGDSMTVRLPQEDACVSGPVGDPAFGRLADGRTFTGQELLGALLGAYDVSALVRGPADTLAYATGDRWVVALLEPDRAHRFAYAAADSSLLEYRQERGGKSAYRVRFSDYRTVGGKRRPFRVELEDRAERRSIRADVRSESFGTDLPDEAYHVCPAGAYPTRQGNR